ncbi:MAG: amidohydrolase family protein [Acidobacteriota bacterium]
MSACAEGGVEDRTLDEEPAFDLIVRHGTVLDGGGTGSVQADVGVRGDRVAAVGDLSAARAPLELDATGLVVAPGFINMLSWATDSLMADGRSMSDILQGVTLEIFGEGMSMGPLNETMKKEAVARQGDVRYPITWTTLGEGLKALVARGISPNVASFVGATTCRIHEVGYEDRAPTAAELARMEDLVRVAMREGAFGVSSSLIYAPASYADTDELVALAAAAGETGGIYISHLRSEGDRLVEAVDELLAIAGRAGVPAEIYHLKAAGERNWHKLDAVIERVEAARSAGLRISANMYTYTAGATGLEAAMPPWVQEGGHEAWVARLRDPAIRRRVAREMAGPGEGWENLYDMAGSPDRILLAGFKNPALKPLTGRSLASVADARGMSPEETAMDLVIEDDSRVGTIYFLMSEANVRREITLPWMTFGSDAGSVAPEGVFLRANPHPRAYGNVARLLGHYVRDEGLLSLDEAVHRLTGLAADHLGLRERGRLLPGFLADLVVFDAARIETGATYESPHHLASGMVHVIVNGVPVVGDGVHTGALPGRVVRGPGWTGWRH